MVAITAGFGEGEDSLNLLFYRDTATGDHPTGESFPHRLACHILLGRLPDRGVEEAFETLTEMADFYSSVGQLQLATQPPDRTPVRSGSAYQVPAITLADIKSR